MSDNFKNRLPDPNEKAREGLNPEDVLEDLANAIDARYGGKIKGFISSSGEQVEKGKLTVLSYVFYLVFERHQDYSYRLLEAVCEKQDGSYPINVTAHYGPPVDYGKANDERDFILIVEKILEDKKTRNVILSMY